MAENAASHEQDECKLSTEIEHHSIYILPEISELVSSYKTDFLDEDDVSKVFVNTQDFYQ